MGSSYLSFAICVRSARFAAIVVLALSTPAFAASRSDAEACKVFHLRLGASVFAIPHERGEMDTPLVMYRTKFEGEERKTGWLNQDGSCSGEIPEARMIWFWAAEQPPFRSPVERGALPSSLALELRFRPPDRSPFFKWYGVTPEQVKTPCRNGFDKDLGALPLSGNVYGCRKDSGRILLWACNFGIFPGKCEVAEPYGRLFLSYRWDLEHAGYDKAFQLDTTVIRFFNSFIVSGEKLENQP